MPLRIFNEFSQLNNIDDFRRFVSAWAQQVHSEINNVITTNITNNSTAIETINNTLTSGILSSNGSNTVVSNTNASNNLAMVRGLITSGGSLTGGEGFSVVRTSLGQYTVTFTTAFADVPSIVAAASGIAGLTANVVTASVSSFTLVTAASGSIADLPWNFIAEGLKA